MLMTLFSTWLGWRVDALVDHGPNSACRSLVDAVVDASPFAISVGA